MKIARIYERGRTSEQDLARQADIEKTAIASGFYIAGIYREKASGARADGPELLRMIADLQVPLIMDLESYRLAEVARVNTKVNATSLVQAIGLRKGLTVRTETVYRSVVTPVVGSVP
ncbi:TPA: recombinase family protein [Salmonella enterica]|nr:recombinase family protein [Salmonella enterica]